MSEPVSTIHYNCLVIEIYWESNVLVQSNGLWLVLPNMTIRNVLYSLGFKNNIINTSDDVLDMYVSSAIKNTIYISNEKPSSIFEDCVSDVSDVSDVSNVSNVLTVVPRCFKSIIKKINLKQLFN